MRRAVYLSLLISAPSSCSSSPFFFFNDTATTEIYTLSLHDALPILTGSSFVDTNLEMQLAGVTLFWSVTNVNIMRSSYVDGLGYPRGQQQYGARWFFTN